MTTATMTIPCPHCLRDPQIEIPVDYYKDANEGCVASVDLSNLLLAMAVHRKQHER